MSDKLRRAAGMAQMQFLSMVNSRPNPENRNAALATIESPKKKRARSMVLRKMLAKVHKRKIARQNSQFHPEVVNLAQKVQNNMEQLEAAKNEIEEALDLNAENHAQQPGTSAQTALITVDQVAQHLAPYIDQHIRVLINNPPTAPHLQKN